MKILYGVQGTGNGHITRARGMAKHLHDAGVEVDYIFSGRAAEKYYAMQAFGAWRCLDGLSFCVVKGKLKPLPTLLNAKPIQLIKDINALPVANYDLVISDFEPVTAWAARRREIRSLGIGHQYAFNYPIPKQGDNALTRAIMRRFAPTSHSIGMHWYHYGQPIVPPIVDTWEHRAETDASTIIVYLPFEDCAEVTELLRNFDDYRFFFYGAFSQQTVDRNVTCKPVSREGFQHDLARSGGVICNAGFELASESISLGKKLLVKPVSGQMEQTSNALALQDLGLGRAIRRLDPKVVRDWLDNFTGKRISYPDVAKHIVDWILRGDLSRTETLVETLWAQTDSHGLATFKPYGRRC